MPGSNYVPTAMPSIEQTDVTDEDLGDVLSRPPAPSRQDNPPPLDPNQALLSVYQDTEGRHTLISFGDTCLNSFLQSCFYHKDGRYLGVERGSCVAT